jgi:hypothetical protein
MQFVRASLGGQPIEQVFSYHERVQVLRVQPLAAA